MDKIRNPLFTDISPFDSGESYQPGDWRKVHEIVHDETTIRGFFGDYRWLSNFSNATVMLDRVEYQSTERAYQASKWKPEDRSFFAGCTNRQSVAFNRENQPNGYTQEEWDAIKLSVMQFLLEQKFDPLLNPEPAQKLQQTGARYIEETNWWNDTFWGKNLAGEGENNLGKLLMKMRSHYASF